MGWEPGYFNHRISNHHLEQIASDPSTLTLEYPGHAISKGPIQSKNYANCCAVVVIGQGIIGLSHYALIRNPGEYLTALIDEMKETGADIQSAVLVGGDSNHLAMNRNMLAAFGIPVSNEYCDGWMDCDLLRPSHATYKHVVAVPTTGEVFVFSNAAKYLQLN